MPGGAGSTSAPWPWTRRAGCWPNSAPSPPTPRSARCGAWPPRNWTAIGAPTAWTTHRRRSMLGGRVARDGRAAAPATAPTAASGPAGARGQPERRGRGERAAAEPTRASGRPVAAEQRHRVDPGRLLGAEPRRDAPGRRRDWQGARAALERLADHHRHRDDRHRPPERARPAAVAATSAARNATAASWQKGAAHAPAPRPRPRRPRRDEDLDDELGRPVYQGTGLSVRALTAEELQRFLDAHAGQPAQLLGSGWAALDPPGHPLGGPRTPPAATAAGAGRAGHRQPRQPRPLRPGRATGGGARSSWPPGPAAWPGGRRWSPPPASPARCSPPRPACRRPGWLGLAVAALVGWRLRFRPSEQARTWQRGAARGAAHRPPAGPAHPRRLRGLPRPGRARLARQRRSPGDRPQRRVRHRHQAVDRQRPPGRRRAGLAQPLPPGSHPGDGPLGGAAGRPRCSAPAPPRCCASTAPTSTAAACTPRAWRSCPPTCSASALGYDRVLSDADVELLATTARTSLRPAA